MLFAMIDKAGGVADFVKNCFKTIEVISEFITFDGFELFALI